MKARKIIEKVWVGGKRKNDVKNLFAGLNQDHVHTWSCHSLEGRVLQLRAQFSLLLYYRTVTEHSISNNILLDGTRRGTELHVQACRLTVVNALVLPEGYVIADQYWPKITWQYLVPASSLTPMVVTPTNMAPLDFFAYCFTVSVCWPTLFWMRFLYTLDRNVYWSAGRGEFHPFPVLAVELQNAPSDDAFHFVISKFVVQLSKDATQSKSCIVKVKVVGERWNSCWIWSKVTRKFHIQSESSQSTIGRFPDALDY